MCYLPLLFRILPLLHLYDIHEGSLSDFIIALGALMKISLHMKKVRELSGFLTAYKKNGT